VATIFNDITDKQSNIIIFDCIFCLRNCTKLVVLYG